MRRTPSAADDRLDPRELVERITAEHGSSPVHSGRHRLTAASTRAAVERDIASPARRPLLRKLAPLAVGTAAMILAATIVAAVRPAPDRAAADLNAALVSRDAAQTTQPPTPTPTPTGTATPDRAGSAIAGVAAEARQRATTKPPAPRRSTGTPGVVPLPGPAGAAVGGVGDGVQAAVAKGWKLIGGDDFANGLSSKWSTYDGAGHAGNGRRSPDAVSVRNGVLTIRGDSNGTTGGMAWSESRKYGKWEMRAKFPAGDSQYHPVLILWPSEVDWPQGGEVDFAETTSASNDVSFFLHYGADNSQKYAKKAIDTTQWHNYAVEWTPQGITGYIDGQQWFSSTDPATLPPGPMHATIQLDYFPDGGSPKPTEMYVDWMRMYS